VAASAHHWPAGPAAPPAGGLALPDHLANVLGEAPQMVTAMDAKTLNQIRTTLAGLHDPVPAGRACVIQGRGTVSLALNETTYVVFGDASCPQAVSSAGGRVRVPAGLGRHLLDLVAASDLAAAKRKHGN
jgi:hypothetical protein